MEAVTVIKRDYRSDFSKYLKTHWPEGDYVRAVWASKIVEDLRKRDPDLLRGWLDACAEPLITAYIGARDRGRRARLVSDQPRRDFAAAVDRLAAGDTDTRDLFKVSLVIDDNNTSRPIGKMTKADHLYVAQEYAADAELSAMDAAFHQAVARKLKLDQTTSDVFTEEQYVMLLRSIRSR